MQADKRERNHSTPTNTIMSANFKSALAIVQSTTDEQLDLLIPHGASAQDKVIEAMRYAAIGGGKRLRPFLLIETVRLFREPEPADWQVAAALEMVHVYSLIHDDLPCMDDDDLRRGKPTVHRAFDEAIAVLAGDALLTRAFEVVANADFDPSIKVDLISMLAKASGSSGMIGGQVIDMTASEQDRGEALITELQRLKTGALIEYALQAGAVLGGATSDQSSALRAFAANLGLAFQIRDDILDVEGDAAVMGKAAQKDENLGKATFVSILGLEGAKNKSKALAKEAKRHLAGFGNDAKILCDTMDFVLERVN